MGQNHEKNKGYKTSGHCTNAGPTLTLTLQTTGLVQTKVSTGGYFFIQFLYFICYKSVQLYLLYIQIVQVYSITCSKLVFWITFLTWVDCHKKCFQVQSHQQINALLQYGITSFLFYLALNVPHKRTLEAVFIIIQHVNKIIV